MHASLLSNDDLDTRIRILQAMINDLCERSFTSRVHISASCYACSPFTERNLKNNDDILCKPDKIIKSTQSKIKNMQIPKDHN